MSAYREQDQALKAKLVIGAITAELTDNFVAMSAEFAEPQSAYEAMESTVWGLCRGLTVHYRQVFAAELLSMTDESDTVLKLKTQRQIPLVRGVMYHIPSLGEHVAAAAGWCCRLDVRSRKALLYFEHACSLRDLADRHSGHADHAAMSFGLAFLQLFKGLSLTIGEKGADRDYQRRFRALGLPNAFLKERVDPLYTVRCDADVAHYSEQQPDAKVSLRRFDEAATVLCEAIVAYFKVAH